MSAPFDPRAPLIASEAWGIVACAVYAAALGAALKVVDDAWDEARYSKRVAVALFASGTASFVALVSLNACFATIVVSLVVGVLVAGKVDTWPFVVGTVAVLGTALAFGVERIEVLPAVVFAAAVALDEWVDDALVRQPAFALARRLAAWGVLWKLAAVLSIPLFDWPPRYAVAILSFDAAYGFMGHQGRRPRRGGAS